MSKCCCFQAELILLCVFDSIYYDALHIKHSSYHVNIPWHALINHTFLLVAIYIQINSVKLLIVIGKLQNIMIISQAINHVINHRGTSIWKLFVM